jgi:monothiol glutaredoxin
MAERNLHAEIDHLIQAHPVILFMKGTAKTPMCGFSGVVCQILDRLGVSFEGINILADAELRQAIKEYTNWPTLPQLYIKGEFVGGADIVREMYHSGELKQLIDAKGIPTLTS